MSRKAETNLAIAREKLQNLRDLSDFCTEWDALKHLVSEEALLDSNFPDETRDVVLLMARFIDKAVLSPKSF